MKLKMSVQNRREGQSNYLAQIDLIHFSFHSQARKDPNNLVIQIMLAGMSISNLIVVWI